MALKIDHLAIWTTDLEGMKDFYVKYFDLTSGNRYHNPAKGFTSYFLSFKNANTRIELMHREDMIRDRAGAPRTAGFAHFAISVGSKEGVNKLTDRLRNDGFRIEGEPRTTGDGYYESVVLDPEGNWIEITI